MSSGFQGPIVGIDLGTTNSVVAAVIDGRPQVLVEDGETIMPSVVAVDAGGKLVVGTVARNQLVAFPERTVASVKRKMGTMERLKMGDQEYTPPEISAMILRRLRDRASRALGQPVERAVITVPAFFDENQRQATREAGRLAGLKVERIINEPTAATLVYHAGCTERKHVVVYDFGGGTFDVSVVRLEDGVVEVLSSQGDTRLGGDDLDRTLMKSVADDFQNEHGLDLCQQATARYRLLRGCEKAKIELSENATAQIREEFIAEKDGQPLHVDVSVDRSEYEELIESYIARTIESVDAALRDAGLTVDQIDDLVLVGGSTRTPLVEEFLRKEFQREPSRAVDPDLAVALGAAVQASMLDGQSVGPVLVDVTGHTLGIEALEGNDFFGSHLVFSPIIHRNTPLPARHENSYYTVHDDQEGAEIHVLQGEHAEVERNRSIGRFRLDLESGGGERRRVVVRFELTLDGTLKVTATQSATGSTKELHIDNALSHFQADQRQHAEERLGRMFDASDEMLSDEELPAQAPASDGPHGGAAAASADGRADELESRYPEAYALLRQARGVGPDVNAEDADEIRGLASDLEQALASDDEATIRAITEELDDILFYVQ